MIIRKVYIALKFVYSLFFIETNPAIWGQRGLLGLLGLLSS